MSRARRRRYARRWQRYTDRYITPENGGLISMADQIGYTKAVFRAAGLAWVPEHSRNWRWSRTSRRPRPFQR